VLLDAYADDCSAVPLLFGCINMHIFASLHPHKNVSKKNLAANFGDLSTSVTDT
jgi:hypothetical protein